MEITAQRDTCLLTANRVLLQWRAELTLETRIGAIDVTFGVVPSLLIKRILNTPYIDSFFLYISPLESNLQAIEYWSSLIYAEPSNLQTRHDEPSILADTALITDSP